MTCVTDARFRELIRQLEAVHLCEVKELRLENQRLRSLSPNGVQAADVQSFNVDIDNPDFERTCSLRSTDESQVVIMTGSQDSREKHDKSVYFQGVGPSLEHTPQTIGRSSASLGRDSLLRRLSRRSQGCYEKRMHWETVPESAQAAWEQATDFDHIEEYTTYAMLALSRPAFFSSNSLGFKKTVSSGNRDARNRLSNQSPWKRVSVLICKNGIPMVDPGTMHRVAWDIVAALLIVYDLITIPLLVFDPDDNLFTDVMGWSCLVFWTLDILASVCTGTYIDGQLVMSRNIVVRRYLKSWFIVDCIAVVPDWTLKIIDSADDFGRLGGVVRMARVTRVLRLLRLAKLKKLMNEFYDMISNEYMFIVVDLIKLLTMILVLNHIVACLWYGVGYISLQSGARTNWLEDIGRTPVYHGDLAWKYTTCLHWSITQFTAASLDIFATNTGERIFSVLIIFWGLLGLSSFVGSVTTTITALRNMSNDHQKQFWLLRKYLSQCRISQQLTVRILRYLEFKAAAKRNILPASKVALLGQLSEQLTSQLKKEANKSILDVHPFFGVLCLQLTSFMDQVCNQALKCIEYAEEDVVFSEAQEAVGMFFVKAGTYRYSENFNLQRKSFMSEAALWTSWSHRQNMVAIGDINEIICILHEPFGEVMCLHPQPWNFAQSYATYFIKALNEHVSESLSDLSMNEFVKTLNGTEIFSTKKSHCSRSNATSSSWRSMASGLRLDVKRSQSTQSTVGARKSPSGISSKGSVPSIPEIRTSSLE